MVPESAIQQPRAAILSHFPKVDRGILTLALIFLVSIPLLTPRVAASDEIEYFSYLHSIFFDHDLDFRDEYQHFCSLDVENCIQSHFKDTFLDLRTPTGLQLNFGPIGSALLWSPFFLAAHAVALLLHSSNQSFAPDGYSAPYVYAISFASLLYGWIGLALSYLLARRFVGEKIALGAALVSLFATSAVYYLYVAPAMSHAPSLFASALFVYVWYNTRKSRAHGAWRSWAAVGTCGALMTMVREQEGLFVIIPLVESLGLVLGSRGRNWQSQAIGLVEMAATWTLVFIPQLVVYHTLNGNLLPAKDVTQKFTWNGVHIGDVLFSDLHGLFTWTPATAVAILGLVLLWRKDRSMTVCMLAALIAEVYLLGSFSTWFGGAAFGMRRFVNCTVLFVIGLAVLVDRVRSRIPLAFLASAGVLLVLWNLLLIVQFATGIIPREQPVSLATIAYNEVFVVPGRLTGIIYRFFFERGTLYRAR